MRLITFILAMILVAASIAPCFDGPVDLQSDQITLVANSDTDQHEAAADLCSPFCMCSCCVTSVDTYRFIYNLHIPAVTLLDIPVSNQSSITNAGIAFWQPPKFS